MEPQPYESLSSIPPKPPDINLHSQGLNEGEEFKRFYRDMVTATNNLIFTPNNNKCNIVLSETLPEEGIPIINSLQYLTQGFKWINLTEEDKIRIYEPWKYSIVVKLFGKRMLHQYLKRKIQHLWRPTETFSVIDLGEDFFIIKFTKKENMEKALHQGPWFVNGHHLSVIKWKPNFVASKETLTSSAIWVRLLQLQTEFYDGKILQKIGNSIGHLLKIDVCTSTTIRGRYARLYVEILLNTQVESFIYIGRYRQAIQYKGENLLCIKCGRLGHPQPQCTFQPKASQQIQGTTPIRQCAPEANQQVEW